jgi:DNA-binding GntR family transcriptional regulator
MAGIRAIGRAKLRRTSVARPTATTMASHRVRRAAPPSLADTAYVAVREEILRGQLRPGTALSRRRLALELGMSVLPVTDALRRLEADGLVESRPRAGTRVRIPSAKNIRDLYELREALESQSARLFAERATPAQRLELQHLAEQVDGLFRELATRPSDPTFRFKVHSRHVRLHLHIAEHAANPLLTEMIERQHVLVLNWLFDVSARRTPLPPHFHSELAAALVSDDPSVADAAMRAHVRYGLVEITDNFGEYGSAEWRERRRGVQKKRA